MKKLFAQKWLGPAFLATFLWSVSKIVIKLGLIEGIPPMLLAGLAQTVAFMVILIYGLIKGVKITRRFTAPEIHALVWLGILGFVLAPLLAIIGLTSVAGSTAGLFAALSPIFVMGAGWLILREKLKLWQIIGGIVAFLGAYVFLWGNTFSGTNFGIFIIIISELCYALNVVLTRLIMRRPGDDSLTVALAGSFLGAIILLPLGIFQSSSESLYNWQTWLVVLVVGGIFAVAGLLWNYALNKLKAFEAGILQNTMLLQIGVLSLIFLGEKFNWQEGIGAIIVLSGAYLVNRELLESKNARSRS